jgi:FAD synthetase
MASPKKPVLGRVLAFGTFDLLHAGHLSYLRQAKRLGKELFVIVARDANVNHFKGYFPVQKERERAALVGSLRMVDRAMLGDKKDFFAKIRATNPQFVAQGYDQWPGKKELERLLAEHGIPARVKPLRPYKKEHHKTTIIKQRIKREY